MYPSLESLGIDKLSVEERLVLVHQIWDSIADAHIPMTAAQQQEMDRRLAAYRKNPADVLTWDEVLGQLSDYPRP